MASDYKKIADDNIERRGTDFDDIGKFLAEEQYSDKTHFIYELLQNAEDALFRRNKENSSVNFGNKVVFKLFSDRLEFRHFGALFNENDVKGITDVLKGSKKDDLSQIGTFGVGFKSVYAFTNTPEIHSGDEHFIIKRYIRPEYKKPDISIEYGETVFNFPFNHENLAKREAFDLIYDKLKKLGPRVLLFLRNTEEIQWYNKENGENGEYVKEIEYLDNYTHVRKILLVGQNNGEDIEESWLVFDKDVDNDLKIEIAYKLEYDQKNKKEEIKKVNNPKLFVYFPTEKSTYTGFIIQGPFKTTPARDNIHKKDGWNIYLVEKASELVVESLEILKGIDLLSVQALETMPINEDKFFIDENGEEKDIFYPLFETVKEALLSKELLPTSDGSYIKGEYAKLGRGGYIRDVFDNEILSDIYFSKEKFSWLDSNITADKTPDLRLYFKECLDIEELRPNDICNMITSNFLTRQTDNWLAEFYLFLNEYAIKRYAIYGTTKEYLFNQAKLIRLEDDSHVPAFDEYEYPNAFISNNDYTKNFDLPIIKRCFTEKEKLLEFFYYIGLKDVDIIEEVIKNLIPIYCSDEDITLEEHKNHIKQIKEAFEYGDEERKDRLLEELCDTEFVLTKSPEGIFEKPRLLYFETEELFNYFDNEASLFVDTDFYEEIEFIDILKEIGIESEIRVFCKEANNRNEVRLEYDPKNRYRKGLNGFDPECEVDSLEDAIENINFKKSEFIWNNIAIPYSNLIKGKVIQSSRVDFSNTAAIYKTEDIVSDFGELLIESEWLPGKDGYLYKPNELFLDDLPDSFIKDENVADKLEMKKNSTAKLAEEVGVEVEDLDFIKQYKEEFEQWRNKVRNKSYSDEFPEKKSSNPERRQEKILDEIGDAPDKEYVHKQRSVRNSRGSIDPLPLLKDYYTNENEKMICQICKEEMPFKKRNGDYYFEAVEILGKNDSEKEVETNHLALCPVCAAMFKEFIKKDANAYDTFLNELEHSNSTEIPVILGNIVTDIRFVDKHFNDLKAFVQHLKNKTL